MELSYTKTVEEVLEFFRVKENDGLSGDEVERLRKKYGHNGERCAAAQYLWIVACVGCMTQCSFVTQGSVRIH